MIYIFFFFSMISTIVIFIELYNNKLYLPLEGDLIPLNNRVVVDLNRGKDLSKSNRGV